MKLKDKNKRPHADCTENADLAQIKNRGLRIEKTGGGRESCEVVELKREG